MESVIPSQSSRFPIDPLSDVLTLLKPRSYAAGGFDVAGSLSIYFPKHDGIKCYAIINGEGWIVVEGQEPMRLRSGDCFLLPRGLPFRLATDLEAEPVHYTEILAAKREGAGTCTVAGGGEAFIAGGHFALTGEPAAMLLSLLPPVVVLKAERDKDVLRWCIERLRQEVREPQPGGFLVAQQLAYVMLVQALRLHLAEGLHGGVGWLFALADKQMCAAIAAMHEAPTKRWTIQSLAERAGMSRSSFAVRFKQTVGSAPMEYLTRWRMLLAADRLTHSRDGIAEIALKLGYESESAFSTAFKRTMGCSPRQYSRGKKPVAIQPVQTALDSESSRALTS